MISADRAAAHGQVSAQPDTAALVLFISAGDLPAGPVVLQDQIARDFEYIPIRGCTCQSAIDCVSVQVNDYGGSFRNRQISAGRNILFKPIIHPVHQHIAAVLSALIAEI